MPRVASGAPERTQESGRKPQTRPSSRLYMNLCKDHPGCSRLHVGAQQHEELWPGLNPRPLASQGLGPSADTHSSAIWHP